MESDQSGRNNEDFMQHEWKGFVREIEEVVKQGKTPMSESEDSLHVQ